MSYQILQGVMPLPLASQATDIFSVRNKSVDKILICFQRLDCFQPLAIELLLSAVNEVIVHMHEGELAK